MRILIGSQGENILADGPARSRYYLQRDPTSPTSGSARSLSWLNAYAPANPTLDDRVNILGGRYADLETRLYP